MYLIDDVERLEQIDAELDDRAIRAGPRTLGLDDLFEQLKVGRRRRLLRARPQIGGRGVAARFLAVHVVVMLAARQRHEDISTRSDWSGAGSLLER
jgi:hypothetical protein